MSEPFLIPKPKRAARWFRRALIPAFLLTLVIPGTREVHWMSARILVPARQGVVVVQGQPPDSFYCEIPNTVFREGVTHKELGVSPDSPDGVLLGMFGFVEFPPADPGPSPSAWSGHPGLVWIAQSIACRQTSRFRSYQPLEQSWREPEPVFALIEIAQDAEPDNGALWLAEAAVHFHWGSDGAGLSALRNAARRPEWNCGLEPMFRYATDRLRGFGFSELDATIAVFDEHLDPLATDLRRHLSRIAAEKAVDG